MSDHAASSPCIIEVTLALLVNAILVASTLSNMPDICVLSKTLAELQRLRLA